MYIGHEETPDWRLAAKQRAAGDLYEALGIALDTIEAYARVIGDLRGKAVNSPAILIIKDAIAKADGKPVTK